MSSVSLRLALDRVEDFVAVQSPLSVDDLGPVLRLQEAAGVGEEERRALCDRLAGLSCEQRGGAVLLGVLVGLFAAQLESGS